MERIRGIDGVRGLSALGVVLFHIGLLYVSVPGPRKVPFDFLFGHASLGVDVFFVLSGFLLALPMLRAGGSLPSLRQYRAYLLNRALRLTPAYYASMALAVVVLPGPFTLRDIWSHLAYVHVFFDETYLSVQSVYWSIGIEAQIYALLPVLVFLMRGKTWWLPFLALLALSVGWRAALFRAGSVPHNIFWANEVPGLVTHFAFGIAVARFYLEGRRCPLPTGVAVWGGVGATFVAPRFIMWLQGHGFHLDPAQWVVTRLEVAVYRPFVGVCVAFALWAIVSRESLTSRLLDSTPMRWLGRMSYSLFLVHLLAMIGLLLLVPTLEDVPFGTYILVLLPTAILGGAIFYLAVERPSEGFRHRRLHRPFQQAQTKAAAAA